MTIKVLKIDSDGRTVRENGDFVWLTDNDAITQLVRQRIQIFKGEWFMNIELGIDYYNVVFPKGTSDFRKYLEFKRVVEEVPGVIRLLSASLAVENLAQRTYRLRMDISADYGTINFDEVI